MKTLINIIVKTIKLPFEFLKKLFFSIFKKKVKNNFEKFIFHIDLLKSRKIDFKASYSNENEKFDILFEKKKNEKDRN